MRLFCLENETKFSRFLNFFLLPTNWCHHSGCVSFTSKYASPYDFEVTFSSCLPRKKISDDKSRTIKCKLVSLELVRLESRGVLEPGLSLINK